MVCVLFDGLWGWRLGRGEIHAFADDGDACGRRTLLGGVVMATFAKPSTSAGETLDPVYQIRQRRHHGVVPFLKALPRLLVSPRASQRVNGGRYSEHGYQRRYVHQYRSFLDVSFLQPRRVLPFTRRLLLGA